MALDNLLETMERRAAATPETPRNPVKVSVKAASILACTPDTLDTPRNGNARSDERVAKVIAKLEGDPGLQYAMETHDEIDPDAIILTLAIRGEGSCEVRIPKSRYDGIVLLELVEKHTTRRTLQ